MRLVEASKVLELNYFVVKKINGVFLSHRINYLLIKLKQKSFGT